MARLGILVEIEKLNAADPFIDYIIVMGSGEKYHVTVLSTILFEESTIRILLPRKGFTLLRHNQISEIHVSEWDG